MDKKPIQNKDYIAGLAKGLAILECFDSERQRISVTLAAEKTGITRAAARRYLLTLLHLGYVQNEGQYFYLTPKILKFSSAYLSNSALAKISQPLLNLIALQTGYICSIIVLDGLEAITLVRSQAGNTPQKLNKILPYGLVLGNRLPAYATSAGKILLAYLDRAEQLVILDATKLKPLTRHTITEPTVLIQQLKEIREQEWCYARAEHELGIHAIAVPIIGVKGKIVAALNMVATTSSCTSEYLQTEMLPLLQAIAQELRHTL